MKIVTLIQLFGSYIKHFIQLSKEAINAFFFIFYPHTLNGQAHNVDGRERQITSSHRCFHTELILKHACSAAHGCHFVHITLRIVCPPRITLIESGIQIEEVGEETACRNLTSQFVKVVVPVVFQIVNTPFLFPYLDRKDSRFAVTHTVISAVQQLAYHAPTLCRGIRSIVN